MEFLLVASVDVMALLRLGPYFFSFCNRFCEVLCQRLVLWCII